MDIFPEFKTAWKRPANVIFPTVWHRFQTKPKDGKVCKIRIEDLPKQRTTEVMQFLLKNYFSDTGLSAALKFLEDETSMMTYKHLLTHMIGQSISILAVIDDDSPNPEIVGLQIISVKFKGDPDLPETPGRAITKKRKIYLDILKNCNPFEIFGSDFFLTDFGLCVAPEFRRLGIATNILNTLTKIGHACDLKGTMMLFTKIESQDLAEKCGFQLYNEIEYSEYKDDEGDVMFSIKGTKSLKLMGKAF